MIKIAIAILLSVCPVHGYIIEQTYEGYAQYNDYYIVNINGNLYEVEGDDLNEGEPVTVWFNQECEAIHMVCGWQ